MLQFRGLSNHPKKRHILKMYNLPKKQNDQHSTNSHALKWNQTPVHTWCEAWADTWDPIFKSWKFVSRIKNKACAHDMLLICIVLFDLSCNKMCGQSFVYLDQTLRLIFFPENFFFHPPPFSCALHSNYIIRNTLTYMLSKIKHHLSHLPLQTPQKKKTPSFTMLYLGIHI